MSQTREERRSKQLEYAYRLKNAGLCRRCRKQREGLEGSTTWLCKGCAAVNSREAKACRNKVVTNKGHTLDGNCWCLPALVKRDGVKIWVHEGGLEHEC